MTVNLNRSMPSLVLVTLSLALTVDVLAQETLRVQSRARPFGLDIVDTVKKASSDPASTAFFDNALPEISNFLNGSLAERANASDSTTQLDPTKIPLQTAADIRVYFVGEGAGYHNTLGFNTTGVGVDSGDPQLIFPDASTSYRYSSRLSPDARRTAHAPLAPGDFVDLGTIAGGTTLDFFLIANGARGGRDVFTTEASANPDGLDHFVSFAYISPDSSYLVMGFEDLLGGGDQDFNDLLLAVDIGAKNVAALIATPEPATWVTLGTMTGLVGWLRRRRSKEGKPR